VKHQAVNALTGFLCFPFVVIIWGTNWLAIKNVLQSSPPLFFTGICLLGGAIAIGAVSLCSGYLLQREGKGRLVAVGLLQMAGGLGLSLVGLHYLDVGTSGLIFYTMPLWLVAIEWAIDRQMQSLLDVIVLTCGMLGLGMLASGAIPVATSHGILGLALLSMATFSWALGTWMRKRASGDTNVWNRTVFQLATAGGIVIVASLLLERRLDWAQLPILALACRTQFDRGDRIGIRRLVPRAQPHFPADGISEFAHPCRRAGCYCRVATGDFDDLRRGRLDPDDRRRHHRNLAAVKGATPCEYDLTLSETCDRQRTPHGVRRC
jgi:drug/metabolite transporter (DMT)-like permease